MSEFELVAESERMPANGGQIQGASPLTAHLGLSTLLVRESVQNSWDARDDSRDGAPVLFEINGWDLHTDELDHLRSLLPVKRLEGFERKSKAADMRGLLHPNSVHSGDSVKVLVISDRNTVGLCGPSRSGQQWDPVREGIPLPRGQQRFANFVRNMGRATSDTGSGDGGAYGVGKSALWMMSDCGTILIHSRTTDEHGEPVERFIGSVHGEHFFSDKHEFTGRHFIGRKGNEGVIEPLVGAQAAAAARGLPLPDYEFEGRATDGTSIVIIAPRLQFEWRTEMERIRDAVRWHVWPKRVPEARGPSLGPDMEIRLGWNNNPVDLPMPLADPEIRPYAKALLDCARQRKETEPGRDTEAICLRPLKVLGTVKFRRGGIKDDNAFHLTLTETAIRGAAPAGLEPEMIDAEPAVGFAAPWGQIALIRREPLLLVRYEPIGGPDDAATEVGVFLSSDDPDVERALTKAEPAAHDDWIYQIVPKENNNDYRRTFARRTLEEIKKAKKALLESYRSSGTGDLGGGEQEVSRVISEGLFGGLGGSVKPKKVVEGGVGGASKQGPKLTFVRTDQDGDSTVHQLEVSCPWVGGIPETVKLQVDGVGYDNSGTMQVADLVSFLWITMDGVETSGPSVVATVDDKTPLSLIVTVRGSIRFRPKVSQQVSDVS